MFQTIALIVVLVAALVVVATMQNVQAVEYQFCIQYDKGEGKVNEHYQGVYTKRAIRPVYDQRGEIASYKPDPTNDQKIYYIPWSRKAVEEIIAKSAPVDKNSIVYTIKFASEDYTFTNMMASRAQFSYEQFANWKWEDVLKWHVKPTTKAAMEFIDKTKSGYNLAFEPTQY